MTDLDDNEQDSPLTPQAEPRACLPTAAELQRIDECLLFQASDQWRKVARVIGRTMMELEREFPHLADGFYSLRVKHLVQSGALEAAGNLDRIRHSEVRIAGPRSS
jgi:hypothetical protein